MNITHYLPSLDVSVGGGVTRSVLDMAGTLAASGQRVTLLTHERGDAPDSWSQEVVQGVPSLCIVPAEKGKIRRLSKPQLAQIIEHISQADLLHLHAIWSPANLQLASAARHLGKPYVVTVHGMLGRWSISQKTLKKRIFLALGGRRYLEKASKVLFSCQEEREQASIWFDSQRGVVHPLPLDLGPYDALPGAHVCREALSIPDSDWPTLLFLSTLMPVKGVEFAIDAVDLLRGQGLNCRLLIAGTGDRTYENGLREQVNRLGLQDRVQFVGYVRGEVKVSLLAMADINVFVSEHENFGFAWAESMAAGTPVIISKGIGPWRELIEGGGAVVAERTGASVASACRELLEDPVRYQQMAERGRAFVLTFLDPHKISEQVVDFYAQAVHAGAC